jgi:O-antigen/teichoic acid export membrane protein
MNTGSSAAQVLRSTFVIGVASGVSILVGVVRVKVVALLLGPAGMGLLGLLSGIMTVASTLAGMGLASSGVRQLAASSQDAGSAQRIRQALWVGHVGFGILGGLGVWALREPIAQGVLGDPGQAGQVGWLGAGVFLSLIATCQSAIQQGFRRIAEMARISIVGTLIGTAVGLLALWRFGQAGVLISILLLPASSTLVAAYYGRRLPAAGAPRAPLPEVLTECRAMAGLGATIMITALMAEATQLIVRSLITQELGLDATGHFHAAWTISMQYVGFVLGAMSADYLPRLSEAIHDRPRANRIVAEQAEISLLLAGPVILAMLALAPWVVEALYSGQFQEAVDVLRWQVLGDILKVAGWPMGFILLAKGERRLFFFTQTLWLASYMLLVWLGLPWFGLKVTGVGFFLCYVIGFAANFIIAYKVNGFRYECRYFLLLAGLLAAGLLIFLAASASALAGVWVGLPLCVMFGCYSLVRLGGKTEQAPQLAQRLDKLSRFAREKLGIRMGPH